jgi:alkylated DNA repair dioxygenase AlkB
VHHFNQTRYISPFTDYLGTWKDNQIPETYSHYSDFAMETLLSKVKPIMEKETGLQLVETYSYARVYKKGDELKRHKDRPSCETSCTMNLGGDLWPIFLEPSGELGKEGTKILLNPGDMLIYRGCDVEHWREPFDGDDCCQVFLHYNDVNGQFAEQNKYDGRPFLGLPAWFKNG